MLHTGIIEPKQLVKWGWSQKVPSLNPQWANKVQASKRMRNAHLFLNIFCQECPWTMFGGQLHKCWAAMRSVINQNLCSKRVTLLLADCTLVCFVIDSLCYQKARCHSPFCPPCATVNGSRFTNTGVWISAVVVRGNKCLGRYSMYLWNYPF